MSAKIPASFVCLNADDSDVLPLFLEDDRGRDEEVESLGNESMRVNHNATASDVLSLDDSVSQIDPGNFSESDIDEDEGGSNYCHSFTYGTCGFPESDIESEHEMSDAGISFFSDVGSPVHSSCKSFRVSEDRDDREDATPLPVYCSDARISISDSNDVRSGDYETLSELSGPVPQTGGVRDRHKFHMSSRRTKLTSTTKRKLTAASQPALRSKGIEKLGKLKATKKSALLCRKRKALAVMRVLPDHDGPVVPQFCGMDSCESKQHEGSPGPKSLSSIAMLDLCINEDETGYLGMVTESCEMSTDEKEKDENLSPKVFNDNDLI